MHSVLRNTIVFLLFAVMAVIVTWPAGFHLTEHIAGQGGDPWQTLWRFEYKYEALVSAAADGALGSHVLDEFFGASGPRLVNLSVWPWMPLYALLGLPQAYNVVWLFSFALSGYAMYLLARWLMKTHTDITDVRRLEWSALIAGLYYMLLPYHFAHSYGHFGAMQMQWLPLLVLVFLASLQRPRTWLSVVFVVLFAVQVWTEHHYALWFALFAVGTVIWFRRRIAGLWAQTAVRKQILLTAAALLVLVLPSIMPTLQLTWQGDTIAAGTEQSTRFSADVFAYVLPAAFHPVWGAPLESLFTHRFSGNVTEATHYLGLVPLLFVMFFFQKVPRQQLKYWVAVAGSFVVLSLGARLHVMGVITWVPLPFAIFDSLPPLSAVRAVGRASVFVGLAMSVLLGWVALTQIRRWQFRGILIGLIVIEFAAWPIPATPAFLSPAYTAVRSLAGSTLIELPATTNYSAASRALYATLTHGKDVVGNAALERANEGVLITEAQSYPALRQLLHLRTTHIRERRPDFFEQDLSETLRETVYDLQSGGILVHTDSLSDLQSATVQRWLGTDLRLPSKAYGDAVLYDTREWLQRAPGDGVFLSRDDRWLGVSYDEVTDRTLASFSERAGVTLHNITDNDRRVMMSFLIEEDSHGQIALVDSEGRLVAESAGQAGDRIQLEVLLPPGATELEWRSRLPDTVVIVNPALQAQTDL